MSDDQNSSGAKDRPVEPPIIEPEAETLIPQAEAVTPADTAEAKGEEPRGRQLNKRTLWVAAAIALLAVAAWGLHAAGVWPARQDDEIASLARRTEALEAANGAMREEVKALAAEVRSTVDRISTQSVQNLKNLEARIEIIEGALKNTQAAIESVGKATAGADVADDRMALVMEKVDGLQRKLAAIEDASSDKVGRAEHVNDRLSIAVANLNKALEEGRPFAAELDHVIETSPGLPGLQDLKAHSATGAPGAATLAASLQAIAEQHAGSLNGVDTAHPPGLWAGLRSRISGLVKVRDLGKARWADGLREAMQHLSRANLDQAIATLQALEGPPPQGLDVWLAEARARAAIERASEVLGQAVRNQTAATP